MNLPMLAGLGLLTVLVVAVWMRPALRRGDQRATALIGGRVLLGGALTAVLALTLLPGHGFRGANLVPGRSIANALDGANLDLALLNIVGNIAMFVPLGALAGPVLRWRPRTVLAAGMLTSVGIEVIQFSIGRSADIDDVVLNTTGAAVGVLLCWAMIRVAGSSALLRHRLGGASAPLYRRASGPHAPCTQAR